MTGITTIGKIDWRNSNQLFGIKDPDRLAHIYCIGKTGVGKSTLLLNMAISDIRSGKGLCIIDPHGELAERILEYVSKERVGDVIYFNATDILHPVAFNPINGVHPGNQHLAISSLIAVFKKTWSESWGPRLEYILRFSLLTLIEYPGSTLLDVQRLLTNSLFRKAILNGITNPVVQAFWREEFEKYSPAFRSEAISPILNKVGAFHANNCLRNIIGQSTSSFSIQEAMDSGKILICNFSKGQVGEDASTLLGSMLLTSIQMAAFARAAYKGYERKPFYLYVDEMHSFVTLSFADILSEARKYGLSLFLTHQFIDQLDEQLQHAIFGNAGTMISFRLGNQDAERIAKEFFPVFTTSDFINLPKYSIYLKLMIDGMTSKPFSATTLPLPQTEISYKEEIIQLSRAKYAKPRGEVIGYLNNRYQDDVTLDPNQLFQ